MRSVRAWKGMGSGVLVLALASCSWLSPGALGEEQAELDRHRRRWRAQRPAEYEYTLRRLCFCPPAITDAVRVRVRDGAVVERRFVSGGAPVDPEHARFWPPVEELFDVIQDAIDRDAHSLAVRYDPEFGYPAAIQIDYQAKVADEELGFTAAELTPLR